MYQERMFGYYPQVIQAIAEFKAIIDAEYPEFEDLAWSINRITEDAYLLTMSEDRIREWEKILEIVPVAGSTFEDRRATIIARIRSQGKLNTELINTIVKTFTGGTAVSWVENSTLWVEITPPPGNKQYIFSNVENEIAIKTPAHLGLSVTRRYYKWGEVLGEYDPTEGFILNEDRLNIDRLSKNSSDPGFIVNKDILGLDTLGPSEISRYRTWQDVLTEFGTWNEVLLYIEY